jgi:hypothetical protein
VKRAAFGLAKSEDQARPPSLYAVRRFLGRSRVTRFSFARHAGFAHKALAIDDLRYRNNQMPACSSGFVRRT